MFDDKPDLQNQAHFNSKKIEFEVTKTDIRHFENKALLSTSSDQISDLIIDFINQYKTKDASLMNKLLLIRKDLIGKKKWS